MLCSNDKLEKWLTLLGHIIFTVNDGLLGFSATTVTLATQYLYYVKTTCEHVREQRCRLKHSFGQSDIIIIIRRRRRRRRREVTANRPDIISKNKKEKHAH
jgi:hypothetical protein